MGARMFVLTKSRASCADGLVLKSTGAANVADQSVTPTINSLVWLVNAALVTSNSNGS